MRHTVPDLLDNAINADSIDLTGLHDGEANVAIIVVIAKTRESRTDTGVDVGVVFQQAFHRCMVEVRAVVNAGDLAGRATEDLGLPSVKVGVEMDHSDGTVRAVHAAKQGQSDGVVTAHGDDTRQSLAVLAWAWLFRICSWLPHQDAVVAFFNLLDRPLIVERSDGHIATVDDLRPIVERICIERHVVAAVSIVTVSIPFKLR